MKQTTVQLPTLVTERKTNLLQFCTDIEQSMDDQNKGWFKDFVSPKLCLSPFLSVGRRNLAKDWLCVFFCEFACSADEL